MFNVNDEVFVNGFFATIVEITADNTAFVIDQDGAESEVALDSIDGHIIPTNANRNDFEANSQLGG